MKTLTVRVQRKWLEAQDVVALELVHADGSLLPAFTAGAHIDLHIPPDMIRQYSLYNDPAERHRYLIGVVRDSASRGGSVAIHDNVREGDLMEISEPRNHFPLARARRHLLVGGGIGVTPMLCMAQRLASIHADYELHYCARTPEQTAFRGLIAESPLASRTHYHYSRVESRPGDGGASQRLDANELFEDPDDSTHVYVCGPNGFMENVIAAALSRGWQPENLHYEYFSAPPLDTSGDEPFDVELASTGEVLRVPVGKSVAQMLQQHGIEVDQSCGAGVCGTCVVGVLEGEPDHRDSFLGKDQKAKNDQFMPCCSRAKSARLVLDL